MKIEPENKDYTKMEGDLEITFYTEALENEHPNKPDEIGDLITINANGTYRYRRTLGNEYSRWSDDLFQTQNLAKELANSNNKSYFIWSCVLKFDLSSYNPKTRTWDTFSLSDPELMGS